MTQNNILCSYFNNILKDEVDFGTTCWLLSWLFSILGTFKTITDMAISMRNKKIGMNKRIGGYSTFKVRGKTEIGTAKYVWL